MRGTFVPFNGLALKGIMSILRKKRYEVMFSVIETIICFAILIYAIIKRWDIAATLFLISTIGYIVLGFMGVAPMSTSVGNLFIDAFEAVVKTWSSSLGSSIMNLSFMFGYAAYMGKIKATDMFSTLCAAPLIKLNRPYLCSSLVLLIGAFIKVSLASMVTVCALFFATLYPILIATGVSKRTAAASVLFSTNWIYGPASGSVVTVMSTGGFEDQSLAEFFVRFQAPMSAVIVMASMVVFYFTCKYFDKKEAVVGVEMNEAIQIKSPKEIGVPYFYGILPLLPVIFCLMFSSIFISSISISLAGACILSMLITFILEVIRNRGIAEPVNAIESVWKGMGSFLTSTGVVVASATVFAGFIAVVGGLDTIVGVLVSVFQSPVILICIAAVATVLMVVAVGTGGGAAAVVGPTMGSIVTSSSFVGNPLPFMHVLCGALGLGLVISPIAPCTVLSAGYADGDIFSLIKREIPSVVVSVVILIVLAFIMS